MEELSTGATSTVTTCSVASGSAAFSLEEHEQRTRPTRTSRQPDVRRILISKDTCDGLQICQSDAIPGLSVVECVARVHERLLRIHYFQRRGFAGLISQLDQSQAFRRKIGGLPQSIDGCAGG